MITQAQLDDWYLDPALFAEEALGVELRRWQRHALGLVALDMLQGNFHLRVHIRCCHSAGKTFLVAILFLWWMITRPLSRGITTAPTQRAVDRLLWSEIRKLYHGSVFAGSFDMMDSSELRIDYHRGWIGLGISSDTPEHLEGYHSSTAAFLAIDEAKAVPRGTRNSLQGLLHSPESFFVATSTPWIEDGWFWEMDVAGPESVIRVVVTIDDLIEDDVPGSEAAKEDCIAQFGGEQSREYLARMRAEYISSSPWSEVTASDVDACMSREPVGEGVRTSSIDFARGPDNDPSHDESVIAHAVGVDVIGLEPFRSDDLAFSVRKFQERAVAHGACRLVPDANGIGAGPTDELTAQGWEDDQVDEFVAQSRAHDSQRFVDRSSEAASEFLDRVRRREIALPYDLVLRRQILQVVLKPVAGGRIKLIKKPKTDGVQATKSPDRFDACIMATSQEPPNPAQGVLDYYQRMADEATAEGADA